MQIEEPEGVDAAEDIAAIDGIDALFVGPADLAICYGTTDPASKVVRDAMGRTGNACKKHGKSLVTFAPNAEPTQALSALGVSVFCIASEHAFMMQAARTVTTDIKAVT